MFGYKLPLGKAMLGHKMSLGKMHMGSKMPLLEVSVMKQMEDPLMKKVSSGLERRVLKR